MACEATGAWCSRPPTQIAPSMRTGQSLLNLLSFFIGLPDSKASQSSCKYCRWTVFTMALEAARVSAKPILPWLTVGGTLRLDFTKWTKRMSHVMLRTGWGHEENLLINSSRDEPVATVKAFWLTFKVIASLSSSATSPTSRWGQCSCESRRNSGPDHQWHLGWTAWIGSPLDPSSAGFRTLGRGSSDQEWCVRESLLIW